MLDRYESFVLLSNGIKTSAKTLSQDIKKALKASNPVPVITVQDDQISVTYPDFSFAIALVTNKDAVDKNKIMAQYFGTERGDLDKIDQAQSYYDISTTGADQSQTYNNDYNQIITTIEKLGQTWSLNPDGYLAS